MQSNLLVKTRLLALLAALAISSNAGAVENPADVIDSARVTYRADREAYLAENLQLTASENAAFWPLYRAYRADVDKLGDGLVKLVLDTRMFTRRARETRSGDAEGILDVGEEPREQAGMVSETGRKGPSSLQGPAGRNWRTGWTWSCAPNWPTQSPWCPRLHPNREDCCTFVQQNSNNNKQE